MLLCRTKVVCSHHGTRHVLNNVKVLQITEMTTEITPSHRHTLAKKRAFKEKWMLNSTEEFQSIVSPTMKRPQTWKPKPEMDGNYLVFSFFCCCRKGEWLLWVWGNCVVFWKKWTRKCDANLWPVTAIRGFCLTTACIDVPLWFKYICPYIFLTILYISNKNVTLY